MGCNRRIFRHGGRSSVAWSSESQWISSTSAWSFASVRLLCHLLQIVSPTIDKIPGGVYWKPVYNLLEGTFTVFLVNATHVKNVPGRKTDKAHARWLAKLMRFGLLRASFIPPKGQRDLRDLTRYWTKLVHERVREVNRVQGVLERANIKLASVIADIMGVSGRAMLEALIAGRVDPATMAELAKRRMRAKIPVLEQALTGIVHDHHRQLLAMQLAHIDFLDEQIEALNQAIEASLRALSVDTPHPARGRLPCPSPATSRRP